MAHLCFGQQLACNYHFSEKIEKQYEDVIRLMGLQPGNMTGGTDFYFLDFPSNDDLPILLDHAADVFQVKFPSQNWIRHEIKQSTVWQQKEKSVWLVSSYFRETNLPGDYLKELRIWSSILLGFPTVMAAQQCGGILMHAALVSYQNNGILISAKGGMGKTTTCRRLPDTWEIHGDDQVLLFPRENGELVAHALPTYSTFWEGKESFPLDISKPVRLRAFFYLNQASENSITPLNSRQSIASLFLGVIHMSRTYWRFVQPQQKRKYLDHIIPQCQNLAKLYPSYHLKLSLSGDFWQELECLIQ